MKNTVKNLITWSPSHLITSPKSAFTLAEVLITLAIIGVVAALTIPTLVANYQTRTWNTSATVFERKLEEALKVMNTQSTLAGHTSTENFVEELSKHLKITKTCANDKLQDCFSDTVFWGSDAEEIDMSKIKTAKDFGQNDWNTNIIGAQFANGVTGLIAYNPTESCKQDPYSNQIVGTGCLAILYDTTGYKTPNTSLKDLRALNVHKLGSKVGCAFELDGQCWSAGFMPTPLTYAECTAQAGELGISCFDWSQEEGMTDTNYWAGAVKYCKDQGGRLPTIAEVENLMDDLYGSTLAIDRQDEMETYRSCADGSQLCWDEAKAHSYGFVSSYDNSTYQNNYLWTSDPITSLQGNVFPEGAFYTMFAFISYQANSGIVDSSFVYTGARCILE